VSGSLYEYLNVVLGFGWRIRPPTWTACNDCNAQANALIEAYGADSLERDIEEFSNAAPGCLQVKTVVLGMLYEEDEFPDGDKPGITVALLSKFNACSTMSKWQLESMTFEVQKNLMYFDKTGEFVRTANAPRAAAFFVKWIHVQLSPFWHLTF